MKLHHKLTTWLLAMGGLAHVGAQLPPIVDLNSSAGSATATSRTTANLADPNANFDTLPGVVPGAPPSWTVSPSASVVSGWFHAGSPSTPQPSAHFNATASTDPAQFPSLSRQVSGLYNSDGSTLSVSFGAVWRGESTLTRTLSVSLGGTTYATITTPTTFTPDSVATVAYLNGATGPATTIAIGNNELNRGFTTVSFQVANPSNGELKFSAATGADLFVIDNVAVSSTQANLITNGSFADSPAASGWTLTGVGTVGGTGTGSPFFTVAGGAGTATLTSNPVPYPAGIESANLTASFKITWTYPVAPLNDHRTLVLSYKGKNYLTINRDLSFTTQNGASVTPSSLDISGTPTTVSVTLPETALPFGNPNSLAFDITNGVSNPGVDTIVIDDVILKGTWKSDLGGYNYAISPAFSTYSTTGVRIAAEATREIRGGLLGVNKLTASIPSVAGDALGVRKTDGTWTSDLSAANLGANYWPTGISVQSSSATQIVLSGVATRDQYEEALDLIRFKSTRSNGATVAVTVSIEDLTPAPNVNVAQALITLQSINNPPTAIDPSAVAAQALDDFTPPVTINLAPFFTNDNVGDPYAYGFTTAPGGTTINGAQFVNRIPAPANGAYDDTTSNAAGDNGNKLQILAFNSATGQLTVRAGRRASQNTATGFGTGKFRLVVSVKEGALSGSWQASKTIEFTASNLVPQATPAISVTNVASNTTTIVVAAPVAPATELALIAQSTDPDGDGGATYPKGLSIVAGQTNRPGTPESGAGKGYFTVNPTTGAVSFNPNGEFDYLPEGNTQWTYYDVEIQDADGGIGRKRVRVEVLGIDDAPYLVGAFPAEITSSQGAVITGDTTLGNGPVFLTNPVSSYFQDDDGPYTFDAISSGLPPGVTFNASTGAFEGTISGTTPASQYNVTVTASDISNTSLSRSVTFVWKVANPVPTLATTTFTTPEDTTLSTILNGVDDDALFGVAAEYNMSPTPAGPPYPLITPGKPAFKIVGFPTKGTVTSAHSSSVNNPNPPATTLETSKNFPFIYLPNPNVSGADSVIIEVTDSDGGTASITLTINITPVDDPPFLTSNPPDQSSKDGQAVSLNIANYFDDVDTPVGQRTYGSYNNILPPGLTLDINTGIISGTLTAAASQGGSPVGSYNVQVRAFDQTGASTGIGTFVWAVANIPPAPQPDIYSVTVPTDIWASNVTVGNVKNGTATAPFTVPNANGLDKDGTQAEPLATDGDAIAVVAGNFTIPASPTPAHHLAGLRFIWVADGTLTLDIAGSSTASKDNLRNLAAGQTITTPDIPYTATDSSAANATANSYFRVTFTGVNNLPYQPAPPVAAATYTYTDGDIIQETNGQLRDVDFRTIIRDYDNIGTNPTGVTGGGDTATWLVSTIPALPGLSIDANGKLQGTLQANASGGTSTSYAVTVKRRDSANQPENELQSYSFTLVAQNKAPTARPDSFTVASETGTASGNVIAGSPAATGKDTDGTPLTATAAPRPSGELDSDQLFVTLLNATTVPANNSEVSVSGTFAGTPSQQGTFFLKRDGSLRFEPGTAFLDLKGSQSRIVTAQYTISDGSATATTTVTVTVQGSNGAPVITVNPVKVRTNMTSTITLEANDPDAGTQLSFSLLDTTDHGTLEQFTNLLKLDNVGPSAVTHNITYTPNTNYVGPDSFQYIVSDDTTPPPALSDTETIPIEVWYVNQPPVAASTTLPNQTGAEGKTFSIPASVVDSNFSDPDEAYASPYNDVLTYTAKIIAQNPAPNSPGDSPLYYPNMLVNDGNLGNLGLAIDANTGAISGTIATNAGAVPSRSYTIEVKATDMGDRWHTPAINRESKTATFVLNIGVTDTDGDGVRDADDRDADNDGIPDETEKAYARNNGPVAFDTDGDGVPDHLDVDSDNDGIYDAVEAGHFANVDWTSGRLTGAVGTDGIPNSVQNNPNGNDVKYSLADTDQDGWADYVDLDSDNDSISDLLESGYATLIDANHDGLADGPVGINGAPLTVGKAQPVNTDGDTFTAGSYIGQPLADFRDLDSNNDGIKDITANGFASLDGNGDGIIDSLTDLDKDGIVDVIDTIQPGFGGFPVVGYAQWAALPGNGSDTDKDVFPLTQEYAFGGSPAVGNHKVGATTHTQGLVLNVNGSAVSGSFVRPQGRFDVTYTLAISTNLTAWTEVASAPALAANGDGTDTLTWTNLQTAGDIGYARLKVIAGGATTYTLPQGWSKTTILGDVQSYSSPLLSTPVLTGGVTFSIVNGLQASTPVGTLATPAAYYVEFTDGIAEGHRFTLSSASGTTLEIDVASPLNTLSSGIPGNLAGSHFVVRKYRTLGDVFASVAGGTSVGTSDSVRIWNGAAWDQYWKRQSDGIWILFGQGLADRSATILASGTGVLFGKAAPGTPKPLWQTGEVRYNDFRYAVSGANTFLATGFPLPASPNGLGLTVTNNDLVKNQTQILIWDGDATPGVGGFANEVSTLRPQGWRRTTDNANTGDSLLFQAFRSGFLRVANPVNWTHPQPVTDSLWSQP